MSMTQSSRYEVLDGMRGVAAILVMLFHYNIQYGYRIFYNVFTAVDFFFILSGFVILHSYGAKMNHHMSSREFIIRRIARLFPMSALGVLLGLPTLLTMAYLGQTNYANFEIVAVAIGNMFFIPAMNSKWFILDGTQISGQIFPTNGPLWSIFFELVISFAFIFLYRLRNSSIAKICAISFLLVVTFSIWNGHVVGNRMFDFDSGWNSSNFMGGIPRVVFGFTCGMLIYRVTKDSVKNSIYKRLNALQSLPPMAIYSLLMIILIFPFYIKGLYSLVEIGIFAPLLVLLGSRSTSTSSTMTKFSESLGLMSFPIYCFHYPILTSLKSIAIMNEICDPQSTALQYIAIVATLIISYGTLEIFKLIKLQQNLTTFLETTFSNKKLKSTNRA
jgi:peptidoglycan/LPS O-acetylase OafA/YrhL